MSHIRIPPLPPLFVLVDRADGTEWLLSHRRSDARFAIDTIDGLAWSLLPGIQRFGPTDGPIMDVPGRQIRWFIRDGRIGYEMVAEGQPTVEGGPQATRKGVEAFSLLLNDGQWQSPGDVLGYETTVDATP